MAERDEPVQLLGFPGILVCREPTQPRCHMVPVERAVSQHNPPFRVGKLVPPNVSGHLVERSPVGSGPHFRCVRLEFCHQTGQLLFQFGQPCRLLFGQPAGRLLATQRREFVRPVHWLGRRRWGRRRGRRYRFGVGCWGRFPCGFNGLGPPIGCNSRLFDRFFLSDCPVHGPIGGLSSGGGWTASITRSIFGFRGSTIRIVILRFFRCWPPVGGILYTIGAGFRSWSPISALFRS